MIHLIIIIHVDKSISYLTFTMTFVFTCLLNGYEINFSSSHLCFAFFFLFLKGIFFFWQFIISDNLLLECTFIDFIHVSNLKKTLLCFYISTNINGYKQIYRIYHNFFISSYIFYIYRALLESLVLAQYLYLFQIIK